MDDPQRQLVDAIIANDYEAGRLALRAGADPLARIDGVPMLHLAIKNRAEGTFLNIWGAGARWDAEVRAPDGTLPLFLALHAGHQFVNCLLAVGANHRAVVSHPDPATGRMRQLTIARWLRRYLAVTPAHSGAYTRLLEAQKEFSEIRKYKRDLKWANYRQRQIDKARAADSRRR